jgi:hypothetical protein
MTKYNMLALDTRTTNIIWKQPLYKSNPSTILLSLIKLKKDYETEIALKITYNPNQK